MTGFVFHDPSGRRAKRAGLYGGLVLAFITVLVAGFAATLALAPRLPNLSLKDPRVLQALHRENAKHLKGKPAWTQVPRPPPHTAAAAKPLTVGFYVSWDEHSRESLQQHLNELDVVAPQWLALKGSTGEVSIIEDPRANALITSAAKPPAVLPLIHNSANAVWNGPEADKLLADPKARQALIDNLVNLAKTRGYAGYMFDLEELSPASLRVYPAFLAQARAALKPLGREVWVTAMFDREGWPLEKMQAVTDTLVLMAYDEHYGTGDPGPVAGQDWYQKYLAQSFKTLDPSRTVLALGAYGYDWTATKGKATGAAQATTFHEAMVNALDSGSDVSFDEASLNPFYAYKDDAGRDHEVWFLDASSAFNQVKVSDPWHPRGYGLWRMGSEDPGIWSVLGKPYGQAKADGLAVIAPNEAVDFDGTGEVLKVTATPSQGRRSNVVDPQTGLIAKSHYDVLPSSYVVQRYGAHPGLVALTFDDGPDGRWTPKILDILKQKNAPATFFILGQNMQRRPDLVLREIREGHDIGSHTWTHPNIAQVSAAQATVELNATQRLFEVITGKSLRLFRPPFFGDAEPSTAREVAPILLAQNLGYLTVGLRVDTDDWQKPSPDRIVARALQRLSDKNPETGGQVMLLHDAGGDRSRTVAALPALIDQLRANGYRLVTVSDLAGMTMEQALPPTSRNSVELLLDRMGFGFFRGVQLALQVLFVSAIVLGLARLAFLAVLAMVHRVRAAFRKPPRISPETGPMVTVLIPCFNEEKVIASSVARILESDWTKLEVIILDDGSTDGTAAEVDKHFAGDPRVRLMSFENGGKAHALNRGLVHAQGEIIVALDADTQFPAKTIRRLTRWFEDPTIGAVAGNALVGNRINLVTRWQALEYVTAQNLERRALAALGAVTVVPGAVGAWRKTALEQLGGYPADTLAEDQDLTLAVQQAGWRVEFDPAARAYTEAPDTVDGLLKQRFRWSFGTLQCLWKHRKALFSLKYPVLGFVALPQIWLFQIILATAAPLVDLAVVWSLIINLIQHYFHPVEASADDLMQSLLYWAAFVLVDLSAGALGMALERRAPWKDLFWLPIQRFGYRQLMYYVVVKAVVTAVRGPRVGWGKLERRATVAVDKAA